MEKKYLNQNVFDAAMERLEYCFDQFDNIYVAFSGGKDSGLLLNLSLMVARKRNKKIGVFHLDYEAQYTATTEYVDRVYDSLGDDVYNLRCCVPVICPTVTSMFENHWRPWDKAKKDIWTRELPGNHLGVDDFDFINDGMTDYSFQTDFSLWWHNKMNAKKTCVLIGIRADESLNRWRTIASQRNINKYNKKPFTTIVFDNVVNCYPIYDWATEDIWTANARYGFNYNKLYDLMYYAGLSIHDMRVASPFMCCAKASLSLYRVIDPHVWGKMVGRVNGVNFTSIYGSTTAMGWRKIKKPDHFTWKQYALFLLDTLPKNTKNNYIQKLETSIKFWREKGGVLSNKTIEELRNAGVSIEICDKSSYKTDKKPVKMNYLDSIESKDFNLIPTWKRLVICILKNDHVGKYMGFSQTKKEKELRETALEKYKNL